LQLNHDKTNFINYPSRRDSPRGILEADEDFSIQVGEGLSRNSYYRISQIVHGKRSISADTAIRLGRYFKMEAELWMNLQTSYDLEKSYDRILP
jgi:hypothetical protein